MTTTYYDDPKCPHCDILINNWIDIITVGVIGSHFPALINCPGCSQPIIMKIKQIYRFDVQT